LTFIGRAKGVHRLALKRARPNVKAGLDHIAGGSNHVPGITLVLMERIPVELSGIPETLFGNLGRRAAAARLGALKDPMAIEVVDQLEYDFADSSRGARLHAVRVATFDAAVRRFLASHPAATVVALGEGLETQFWRIDNGQVRWLTVELPETMDLRDSVLRDGPRQSSHRRRYPRVNRSEPARLRESARGVLVGGGARSSPWATGAAGHHRRAVPRSRAPTAVGFVGVPTLAHLLERMRRVRLPPGAPATVVAVPSAGDGLASEVAFLFDDLDRIEASAARELAAARSDAEAVEASGRDQRRRLLDAAHVEAEQVVVQLLDERRAAVEQRTQAMLDEAAREAEDVLARGRERTPPLLAEIVQRVLEGPG
jgi:vacuolar-type H+-ATPase subunit H